VRGPCKQISFLIEIKIGKEDIKHKTKTIFGNENKLTLNVKQEHLKIESYAHKMLITLLITDC